MEITNNFKTMKRNVFTKFSVTLVLLFAMTTSLLPNKAKGQTPEQIEAIADAITAIIEAVCPETPQNRCKNGECMPGSCFSFRKACSGTGAC